MKDLGISVVIGAALSGSFNTVLGRSIKQFDRLGSAIKETQARTRNITAFEKLRRDLAAAETAFQQAKDRLATLGREMQNTARPTRQMRANLAEAHKEVHRLGQRLDQQRQALMQQRRAMQAAGQSTAGLTAQKKRLGDTVGQLRRQYDRLGSALKRRDAVLQKRAALRAQLVDTVALGAAIAAPVRAAMQFESVMADVKKVVNFDSPEQFLGMQKDLLKLSTVIPMSASGLGEIMAAAGQAGIARDELRQFTADAAKMGVAFDMTGADAGSAMTGLRSIFKLNQPEVIALGDAYNHLSNNMDATARDMLKIANRTGSTAELFGLTGQQVGTLGATFLALKTPPEVAATGINALLLKLQTADKQGGRFQDALASMGMAAGDLKQAIAEDAQGALVRFLEAVRSSGDVTGNLADLFGAEYADDMAKLVGNLDLYRKSLGLIAAETHYAGSMQAEYAERARTTTNNMQLFRNQVNRLGVSLGSVMLPGVNSVLGGLGSLTNGLVTLTEKFPLASKVIIGLTTGLIAMKVAAIGLAYTWTFVAGGFFSAVTVFRTLGAGVMLARAQLTAFNAAALVTATRARTLAIGSAIKRFGAALAAFAGRAVPVAIGALRALTVAFMSNPVGLIIGGIALAAGLLVTFWQPIKGFFSSLWSGVSHVFSTAWAGFKTLLAFSPLALIAPAWRGVTGFFGGLWDGIIARARAALDWVLGKFRAVTGVIRDSWQTITGWFGGDDDEARPTRPGRNRRGRASPMVKPLALATVTAATPVAAEMPDMSEAYAPTRAAPVSRIVQHQNIQIEIHPQPGQDARLLAEEILREFEARAQGEAGSGLNDAEAG